MNALKAAAAAEGSRATLFQLRVALFHSTPVLERKRRTQWHPKSTYNRRPRKHQWKHSVLCNFNTHAEDFFQCWIPFLEQEDMHNRGPSWFTRDPRGNGSRRQGGPNQGHKERRTRGFEFCNDDDIDGDIFRAAFGGGERISFWSFIKEDNAQWKSSSGYTNGHRSSSRQWRCDSDGDEESSSDSDSSESTSASDRLVLGLSPNGPLKLDEIKHAYRTCALKYHPDRHQGPSKNAAEEKFKLCTVAYQSLCDELAVN